MNDSIQDFFGFQVLVQFVKVRMFCGHEFPQRYSVAVSVDGNAVSFAAKYFGSSEERRTDGARSANTSIVVVADLGCDSGAAQIGDFDNSLAVDE